MGTGPMRHLPWCVALVVVVATLGLEAAAARGGDEAAPRRGEIVIRPTGRRVRVVTVRPAERRTVVRVAPAMAPGATTATTAAAPAARGASRVGWEYGEQSVRLPLGYDPRDSAYGGAVIHCPAPPPPTCPSGYGYSAHGSGIGFGYGYGWGRAGCGY